MSVPHAVPNNFTSSGEGCSTFVGPIDTILISTSNSKRFAFLGFACSVDDDAPDTLGSIVTSIVEAAGELIFDTLIHAVCRQECHIDVRAERREAR